MNRRTSLAAHLSTLLLLSCATPVPEVQMAPVTEAEARSTADAFVAEQWGDDEAYALEFESIRPWEDTYQVRYTKVFKEPTKENPPYRLVVIDAEGNATWGRP